MRRIWLTKEERHWLALWLEWLKLQMEKAGNKEALMAEKLRKRIRNHLKKYNL